MESSEDLTLLNRLYSAAERAVLNSQEEADGVFGAIGLFLDRQLVNGGYYCTPTNTSAFAWTGGDGVHFSFLHIDGKVVDQSPIVMTVALSIHYNVIVGKNLVDFLRLGSTTGYFDLQTLAYSQKDYLQERETADEEMAVLLQFLIDEFSLTPLENVGQHLEQLKEQYLHLLQLPPNDEDVK